jgi:hypothetical protein
LAAVVVAASAASAQTSSITGRVSFEGTPPAPERAKVSDDPRCAQQRWEARPGRSR